MPQFTFTEWLLLLTGAGVVIIVLTVSILLILKALRRNVKSIKIPGPKGDLNIAFNNDDDIGNFKSHYSSNDDFEEASAIIGACKDRLFKNQLEAEKRTLRETESRAKNLMETIHESLDKAFNIKYNFMTPYKASAVEEVIKLVREILKQNHLTYKTYGSTERTDFLHEKSLNMYGALSKVFVDSWPIFPEGAGEGTCQEIPDYNIIKDFFRSERLKDKILTSANAILEEVIQIAFDKANYEGKQLQDLDDALKDKFKMSEHMINTLKNNILNV